MTSIENMFYEVFRIKGEQHRDTGYQPRSHSRLHAQTNMKRRSSSTRLSGVTVPEGLPEDDCDTPKQMKRSNTSVVPVSGTVPTNSPSIDKIVVVKPEVAVASPVKCEKLAGKLVGYHSSAAGGVHMAVVNAASAGANAFALWTRNQRRWDSKPLEEGEIRAFKEACATHSFPSAAILPHGSYLINCGSPSPDMWNKSVTALTEEMTRCQQLGLTLYNFHPGSTCGEGTVDDALARISKAINQALAATSGVTAVIENMAGQGNTVGGKFTEIRRIIDGVEDKSRVGVCIDTCHAFAAGIDLRTPAAFNAMLAEFDSVIGLQYLKGMHLNDSKSELGCNLDRHEKIGKGCVGLECFRCIMNDDRLDGIPLILETPPDSEDNAVAIAGYKREIDLLRSLVSTAAGGAVGGRKGASVLKDAAAAVKGEPVTAVKETTEKDAVEVKRESKGRKKTTQ